ncbi:UBP-type zinc finger domain-containing protein [Streptomyces sp. NPDC087917]|uniref:UBP-type zinc finger domain-containing protein n=1 Tax=Streptomyces sp. NPDC087917 TaxID=3155060 RepID=UPI00343A37B3
MNEPDGAGPGWIEAPDPGRPNGGRTCPHVAGAPRPPATATATATGTAAGCAECLAAIGTWVRLLVCLSCGHVGCCDSSRGKHAWAHAERSGHVLARSAEEGARWAWCYADELYLVPAPPADPV